MYLGIGGRSWKAPFNTLHTRGCLPTGKPSIGPRTEERADLQCKLCIIDLQVLSDAIFFGRGNLGLKIVAMSYEMSLCFGSVRTYRGQTARA